MIKQIYVFLNVCKIWHKVIFVQERQTENECKQHQTKCNAVQQQSMIPCKFYIQKHAQIICKKKIYKIEYFKLYKYVSLLTHTKSLVHKNRNKCI